MVNSEEYWSPIPVFILFRESIEASIIVAVLLSFLDKSGPWLKKQVWWGVGLGFVISIIIGVVFIVIFYAAKDNVFQGKNQNLFKGSISLLAAVLIAWLAFIMLRFMGWERKWQRKLNEAASKAKTDQDLALARLEAAKAEGGEVAIVQEPTVDIPWYRRWFLCESPPPSEADAKKVPLWAKIFLCESDDPVEEVDVKPSKFDVFWRTKVMRKPMQEDTPEAQEEKAHQLARMKAAHAMLPPKQRYNIFFLAFFTVIREGLEVVVFLAGVGNAKPTAIPLSGFVGIICGICVGIILYYTGKTIENVKWLMIGMATVLFFIGAGQAENGGNSLMYGGAFGDYVGPAGWAYPSAPYASEGLLPFGMDAGAGAATDAAFNDGDEYVVVFTNDFDDKYIQPARKEQPWYFWILWDISGCCSHQDEENRFLALMNKIVGYNATPCFIDVVFYCSYWIIVLFVMLWKLWRGTLLDADYKHTRMLRQQQEQREAEAKQAELKGLQMTPAGRSSSESGTPVAGAKTLDTVPSMVSQPGESAAPTSQ